MLQRSATPGRMAGMLALLAMLRMMLPLEARSDPSVFYSNQDLSVPAITLSELNIPSGGSYGSLQGDLEWGASAIVVDSSPAIGYFPADAPGMIVRRIEQLWSWRVLKNKVSSISQVSTAYTIRDQYGRENRFTSVNDLGSSIAVECYPLEVELDDDAEKNNQWLVTQSVDLHFSAADAYRSGQYAGYITVIVTIEEI